MDAIEKNVTAILESIREMSMVIRQIRQSQKDEIGSARSTPLLATPQNVETEVETKSIGDDQTQQHEDDQIQEIQATVVISDIPKMTKDLDIFLGKSIKHVEVEASCESQASETPVAGQHIRCTRISVKRNYHKVRKRITRMKQRFHCEKGSRKKNATLATTLANYEENQQHAKGKRSIGDTGWKCGPCWKEAFLQFTRINQVWDPGGVIAKQVYGEWLEKCYKRSRQHKRSLLGNSFTTCSNNIFPLNLEVKVLLNRGDLIQNKEVEGYWRRRRVLSAI